MTESDGPPRAVYLAALILGVAAVLVVLAVAASRPSAQSPVPVAGIPAPQAEGPECAALSAALPDELGDHQRAPLAEPAPAGAAAWRADPAAEPVILRCGLDRPGDFVVGAPIQMVDDVSWFRVAEGGRVTWYAVDRPVYIALTLPEDSGSVPIQQLSGVIAAELPAQPIDPAPPR